MPFILKSMCLREASLKTVVWFQLFQKRWNYGGREKVVVRGVGDKEGMDRQNKTFRARDELLRVMLQGGCMYHRIRQKPTGCLQGPWKGCVYVSRQVICKWYIPLLGRIAGGLGTQRPLQQLRKKALEVCTSLARDLSPR